MSCMSEEKESRILKCGIQFFFRHVRFDESTVSRMSQNEIFQIFDEYVDFLFDWDQFSRSFLEEHTILEEMDMLIQSW